MEKVNIFTLKNNKKDDQKDQSNQASDAKQSQQNSNETNKADNADKKEGSSEQNNDQTKKAKAESESQQQKQDNQDSQQQANQTIMEKLEIKSPTSAKVLRFCIDCWQETFPDEKRKARDKIERMKKQAQEKRKQEEKTYTEEELKMFEDAIPAWKKNALLVIQEEQKKETMTDKVKEKLKSKFNKTEFAQQIYKSEEYKEYQEFKKDVSQLKEDVKDRMHNSSSNIIQGSMYIMDKISNETAAGKAINEMRKIDPEFDLWELESEASVIFEQAYNQFLQGNLENLEKVCSDAALGYFKVLLKKRETEKLEPKIKQLWQIERSSLSEARIPDNKLPTFVFLCELQEIYCFVNKDTKKIVEGSEDRVQRMQFQFAVRLHSTPDIELAGHKWEIVEIQPREIVLMLV